MRMDEVNYIKSRTDVLHETSLDDNRFYSMSFDDLENEALNETTDFNEICKIISFLASSIRARETEYRDDNDNRIENLLLKIQEKRKEYFVKLKIQGILRQPLEGISEEMKDQIMSQNGERYNGHNFDLFVEDNYEYCKWIEWGWDKDKLEISHLRNSGITPNYPDFGYDNRNRSRTQRSFDEMCIYTKLSDNYGVVYSEIGGANKIFKIDDDYKKDLLHREKNFGQLSQNDYAHYVNLFEKSLQSGNSDDLLKLLLIYPELPEDIRVALEKIFSEQIASFDKNPYISLFKEKVSPGVFERILDSHKDTLLEIVDEKKPEIERVINLLSTKFKNIQENNALRFFGYKDEGIDSIDFYLSFIEQDPRSIHPPHYTLYYYLNIRRYLPQYLIDEFETNFDLPIPDPIKNLKTEDQFLALSENTFVSIFGTDVPKLGEMIMWLSGRLSQLKNEIKEKLPEFEEVTPEDVFSSEGVGLSKSGLDIENYFIMMEPRNRINLREKFGIDISDFDLRTQISVLKFLSNRDGSTIDTLSGGIKVIQNPESRRDAFRVLLANEEFPEIEHVLISYARFPEIMLPLYKKYAELVSSFNEVEAFLYKTFKSKFEHEAISKIRELLIQKANTVLIKNVEGINTLYKLTQDARHIENKYEEQDDTDEMPWWVNSKRTEEYQSAVNRVDILKHEILSEIERVNTDTVFFLNSFKTLKEAGSDFSLEDIEQCEFAIRAGSEIPDEDIATMRSIYSQNQSSVGAHDEIMAHFDTRVQNPDARFYIFKRQGIIQSFIAFEPSRRLNGALEATSFNVSPEARGYKIGEAMLEEAIEREAYYNILEAECYAHLPISSKYIETGWVADGYFTEAGKNEGGIDHLLTIQRNNIQNELYWGKGEVSTEQITRRQNIPHYVTVTSAQEQTKLPFEEHFGEGRVLTRMFFDPITRKYFGVFEPHRRMRSHHNTPESSVDGV